MHLTEPKRNVGDDVGLYLGHHTGEDIHGVMHHGFSVIVVRRTLMNPEPEALYTRSYVVCNVAHVLLAKIHDVGVTQTCIACLAIQTPRIKCRRGSCGKLKDPYELLVHRDSFELYCWACANLINAANKAYIIQEMKGLRA